MPELKRLSPYAEDEPTSLATARKPVVSAVSGPSHTPYLGSEIGQVTQDGSINLARSQLSFRDRRELFRLTREDIVSRIIWLRNDAIVLLRPDAQFGEAISLRWDEALFDKLANVLDRLNPLSTRLSTTALPPRRIARPVLVYLSIVLLVFAVFNLPGLLTQVSFTLNPPSNGERQPAATEIRQEIAAKPAPTGEYRLLIPKIGVDAPVIPAETRDNGAMQKALEQGVAQYPGTAFPGEPGNIVIAGHSSNYWWVKSDYNYVFIHLEKIEPGDLITAYYQGKSYTYKVTSKKIVEPNQVGVLDPTVRRTLTLQASWPLYTAWKRLIITADQIDPPQTGKPTEREHLPQI